MPSVHVPVLLSEVIENLNLHPGDNVVDATLGGGGHAEQLLKKIAPDGRLLGLDADPKAVALVKERFASFKNRIQIVNSNFENIQQVIEDNNFSNIKGVLIDLGWSTNQLVDEERGFSFNSDGNLDLRFNPEHGKSAADILNFWPEEDLYNIFKHFGEEPRAKKIARAIVERRKEQSFRVVSDLATLITSLIPARGKIHPATKIWQALRMAVNNELTVLEKVLPQAINILASGGRLAVISFHSGEDRIVKNFFKTETRDCLCPPSFPECRCGHKATIKIITKKPIRATSDEIKINNKSRSAILRVAEKK